MTQKILGLPVEKKFFKMTSDGPKVVGSKCKQCNKVYFPKKNVCPSCMTNKMDEHELSKRGKLISFSVSHDSLMGIPTPYAFGYVMLEEDGIMLFTLLTECEPFNEKLRLGMKMEMVIEHMMKDFNDNDIFSYKFRPVEI